MTLLLGAKDVAAATDMVGIMRAIEEGLRAQAAGQVVMPDRLTMPLEDGIFRIMPVVANGMGRMGFKAFSGSRNWGARYMIALFEQQTGDLLGLLDANELTATRTGAVSGIATRVLARSDSRRVGVLGSGMEAASNLEAICVARDIEHVAVFSPRMERREGFAVKMSNRLGLDVVAADSEEDAVAGADIVLAATNTGAGTGRLALHGDLLEPGTHVNAIGSTMPNLRELDTQTFLRAAVTVVDSRAQAIEESGDIRAANADRALQELELTELHDVLAGTAPGRPNDEAITVFKSVGTAIQDLMAGEAVLAYARQAGIGLNVGELLELKQL